jgi:HK97 family phage portal protein
MSENKVAEVYERTVADLAEYDAKDSSLSRDITNDVSDGRWMLEDRAIADTMTLKSLFYSEDWVYIVVDLIAGKISNQFLRVMKQTIVGGKMRVEPAENHPVQAQIENPNPLQDYHAWMYAIGVDATLCGNSLIWKRKAERQMITIPAEGVALDFDRNGVLSRYLAYDTGIFDGHNVSRRMLEFTPDEIIHVRRPNPSSLLWGLSPFVPGQKSVLFNRYSQEYLNSFYLKGATPGLALTIGQEANEAVALRMLRSFEMAYTGRRNQRRTMILPKGVTASPVGHTIADQRLEYHIDRNRESILALLKVPKQEVGLATTGSLGSEEYKTAVKNFWASTLKPMMRLIAGALTLAFKQELGERYFLEFDLSDVDALQEDKLAKANLATAMKTTRTLNEIREEIWEAEPVEGGDALPGTAPMPAIPGVDAAAEVDPSPSAGEPVSAEAQVNQVTTPTQSLNGAQVSSLVQVVASVATGQLPRQSGVNIIRVSFALSEADAEAIMGDVGRSFTPTPEEAPAAAPAPPTTAPETASAELGESKTVEDESTKGVERVRRLIKSNGDWFDRREAMIRDGAEKASVNVMKSTLKMFSDQAEAAIKLVKKFLEEEKNYEAPSFKSDGAGRRSFKAAKIKNKKQLEKRLREDLNKFTPKAVSPTVDALEATAELGYGSALDVPFKLPAKDEIAALRAKGKKQRRAILEERGISSFAKINETTTNSIMGVIERGVSSGKSVGQIAKDIADRFRDVENIGKRAQVIARTETLTAVSIGQAAAMQDAAKVIPDLDKMWINAGDERVRGNPAGLYKDADHDHWSLQGEVVPHDKKFSNGLRFPRDPKGAAGDVIQCRCTWIMMPRDQMEDMNDDMEANQTPYERGEE